MSKLLFIWTKRTEIYSTSNILQSPDLVHRVIAEWHTSGSVSCCHDAPLTQPGDRKELRSCDHKSRPAAPPVCRLKWVKSLVFITDVFFLSPRHPAFPPPARLSSLWERLTGERRSLRNLSRARVQIQWNWSWNGSWNGSVCRCRGLRCWDAEGRNRRGLASRVIANRCATWSWQSLAKNG